MPAMAGTALHASRLARLRGLYAITPDSADTAQLLGQVSAVLAGGARILQYRNKTADPGLRLAQARGLRALTLAADALLIINDDPQLAQAVQADGVHIGRGDADLADTRRLLGADALIGASCYNAWPLAEQALAAGADHVAFGAAFPSLTKPGAVQAPLDLYREARARTGSPIVAIGGIDLHNASSLLACGVDALAVIGALFGSADPGRRAAAFCTLYALAATAEGPGASGDQTS